MRTSRLISLVIGLAISACRTPSPPPTPTAQAPTDAPSPVEPLVAPTPTPDPGPRIIEALPQLVPPTSFRSDLPEGAVAVLGTGEISASVSPDSRYFAIVSAAGVEVYDFDTLESTWGRAYTGGFGGWINESEGIVVGNAIRDVRSGAIVSAFESDTRFDVVWSPDGRYVAHQESDSSMVVYDLDSGEVVSTLPKPDGLPELHQGVPYWDIRAEFSPDGQILATSYSWILTDGVNAIANMVVLWQVADGSVISVIPIQIFEYNDVIPYTWSPDLTKVAVRPGYEGVTIWDIESGEKLADYGTAQRVQWSEDGKQLVVLEDYAPARRQGIRLVDTDTWQDIIEREEPGHPDIVSPDFRLYTTSQFVYPDNFTVERVTTLRDLESGEPQIVFNDADPVGFSHDGSKLLLQTYPDYGRGIIANTFAVWNRVDPTSTPDITFRGSTRTIDLAWSPDGTQIGSLDGVIVTLWDAVGGAHVESYEIPELEMDRQTYAYQIVWDASGTLFAIGDDEARPTLRWSVDDQGQVTSERIATYSPIALSHDGEYLLTAERDVFGYPGAGALSGKIWGYRTADNHEMWQSGLGGGRGMGGAAWSPDGSLLAIIAIKYGSLLSDPESESELQVRDGQTGEILRSTRMPGIVPDVAWSPDGTQIVGSFYKENRIDIWDVETLATVNSLASDISLSRLVGLNRVAWSPDGRYVAASSGESDSYPFRRLFDEGLVMVWDAQSGDLSVTFEGHRDMVLTLDFSPDSTMLASGGLDGLIILWGLP